MRRRRSSGRRLDLRGTTRGSRALLRSDDARDVRLGLDLLAGVASPASAVELRTWRTTRTRRFVSRALVQLAANGDARAAIDVGALVHDLARSGDPADRRAAAAASGARRAPASDHGVLVALLDDPDPSVRAAALDAGHAGRRRRAGGRPSRGRRGRGARAPQAVRPPRSGGSATRPSRCSRPRSPATTRRGASRPCGGRRGATEHGVAVIEPRSTRRTASVVLTALDALDAAGGRDGVAGRPPRRVFDDAASHAARTLAARSALAEEHDRSGERSTTRSTSRADSWIAVLALRHGDRVRDAVRGRRAADGQRRALGVEALDVLLSREEAAIALPLVRRDLTRAEQPELCGVAPAAPTRRSGSPTSPRIRTASGVLLARRLRTARGTGNRAVIPRPKRSR